MVSPIIDPTTVDHTYETKPFYIKSDKSSNNNNNPYPDLFAFPLADTIYGKRIVLENFKNSSSEFTFIAVPEYPGYGLIKHISTGLYLHHVEL